MSIRLKKRSMRAGVKIPETKLTAESPIEVAPLPETVILSLQQNVAAPSEAMVKKGDKVLACQKIADSDNFGSTPVHATVSGDVAGITVAVDPSTGQVVKTVVITPDGVDKCVELQPLQDLEALSLKKILERIRQAGIVGMGGARFPTHVKLSVPKDKKIDTVILNGCESEPYITANHRVMLEYGEKVLSGLNVIKKLLSPTDVYIAIGDDKEDAMEHLERLTVEAGYDFKIAPVEAKYPVGAEKALIKTILNREVPIGGLPMDIGVIVHNVSTAKAVHDAIYEGKPSIEGVVTVTGAVRNPKNLLVRFGTPVKNLIEYCGGITEKGAEVVLGGPMTGVAQFDLDFPVCKGDTCVLVKAAQPIKATECVSCGQCIDVCPMGLMPTLYIKNVKVNRYAECQEAYIDNCIECGVCAYVCPSDIPILQYIKIAKRELSRRAEKK